MKAFFNPQTRVLKCFGFVRTNEPGDIAVEVPDTFAYEPGTVRLADDNQEIEPYSPPVDLAAYAARLRYEKETGGLIVGGVSVKTDRESQAMVSGAYNYVQQNPAAKIKWKVGTKSFVDLNAATVTAIANAIGEHVQACFSKEAEVAAAVGLGQISDTAGIDAKFAVF